MPIEFDKGTLFMTVGDKTTVLGEGIPFIEDIELSGKEYLSHQYHLNAPPELSFEIHSVDLARLDDFCSIHQPNEKFIIEYSKNIMIQARWHKKKRINKKYLKRYGMKPDTVKIRANATVGEYHADDGSFDFETDKPEYVWRPDQKRKGLKIER